MKFQGAVGCVLPVVLLLGVGCAKRKNDEPQAAATASVTAPSQAATAPPSSPAPGGSARPSSLMLGLGERLESERQRKTEGTPRAEEVYAAIEKSGIKLTDKKQHVAHSFGALYCLSALGPGETAFSACEYETPEAAAAGKVTSAKAFDFVPNRELVVHKKTLLTVRQPAVKTKETEAVAKKSFETLAKL